MAAGARPRPTQPAVGKLLSKSRPRVLHVVESLDRGAVESWLVRMMAHGHARGRTPDWTFYCQLATAGARDEHVRAMGGRIAWSPVPLVRAGAFMAALRGELRRGSYEVMHCHHDLVSAVYMAASAGLPLRRRIVHAHNADEQLPTASPFKAAVLREPMRRLCLSADKLVGISGHTLDTLLGGRRRRPGRDVVHCYGVDPTPYERARGDRMALRHSLDLAEDAIILLFGGRIVPEKNPVFVVDVLAQLARLLPQVFAVFAGAGSLESAVADRAKILGVPERVHILGWRTDMPEILTASDLFILPRPERPKEGFGLAVVEAQLAGLPMLLSWGVPDDPLLPTARLERLSLDQSSVAWAEAALRLLEPPRPDRIAALKALAASPMEMDRALAHLLEIHA